MRFVFSKAVEVAALHGAEDFVAHILVVLFEGGQQLLDVLPLGHAVGGVCPFAVNDGVEVYLDVSLKRFPTVFPAAGSSNSAIELTCDELFRFSNARCWVDVCKDWREEPEA